MKARRWLAWTLSLSIGAATTSCLEDAQTTKALCDQWGKKHYEDPECGPMPTATTADASAGSAADGGRGTDDAQAGGSNNYVCKAKDAFALRKNGSSVFKQLGVCYAQIGPGCFVAGSNCIAACLNKAGAAAPCSDCLAGPDARDCVKASCSNGCATSDSNCAGCIQNNCAQKIGACIPVS